MLVTKIYAQEQEVDCETTDVQYQGGTVNSPVCLPSSSVFLSKTVSIFLVAATLIAFAMLIMGGMRYITASGDQMQTARAKATITYAIIGLVVAIFALTGWVVIGNIIGVGFM